MMYARKYVNQVWESDPHLHTLRFDMSKITQMITEMNGGLLTDGNLNQEPCTFHKHVEWDVRFTPGDDNRRRLRSPKFTVGGQGYYFRLVTSISLDEVELAVVRGRPPRRDYGKFWAGIKLRDGSFNVQDVVTKQRDVQSGKKPSWIRDTPISVIHLYRLVREKLSPDGRVTVFLRFTEDRPQTGMEICLRDIAEFTPTSYGSILEEECPAHKYVEWKVCFKRVPFCLKRSPAFWYGDQVYVLELIFEAKNMTAVLYRMGPAERHSARWCAGLKLADGTRGRRSISGGINLRKAAEFWRKMPVCNDVPWSVLESQYLSSDGFLTFFFRISDGSSPSRADTCTHFIHDMTPLSVGSISEEDRSVHRRVEWNVRYKPGVRSEWMSPSFQMHEQRCLFVLNAHNPDALKLRLFRVGASAGRHLRWWVGVCGAGSDHPHYSECGELAQLAADVWTPKTLIYFNKPEKDTPLRVSFLFSARSESGDPQAVRDSKDDIVFKVREEAFAFSKSILGVRIPVLEAMFLHDSLENRTGVMHVEDCEPAVFQVFLNFAYVGDPKEVTVDNVFALYVIADKYFFDPLKSECFEKIRDNLTRRTVFETASLAFRYEDEDMMKRVSFFLYQDQNFMHTDEWLDFCVDNPRAKELLPNLLRTLEARRSRRPTIQY